MTCYFTSITANYFAKARILGETLKKHNPGAFFVVIMSDPLPDFIDLSKEPIDEVIFSWDIELMNNPDEFFFKHTVTELCTAVKGMSALWLIKKYNVDSVVYLDPDIAVFDSLAPLEAMFEQHSILITPHTYSPETLDTFIKRNEILFLKRGLYNFGFFGVKNDDEGLRFLNWWNDRLKDFCFDDNYDLLPELEKDGLLGLFTDQKWADFIPCYFERVKIIKEPGYNVCTWNLTQRHFIIKQDGKIEVDGKPLYFFHFSGYDSGAHRNELELILKHYPRNATVRQLSDWYGKELKRAGQDIFGKIEFSRTCYSNGERIENFERKLYHIRKDIHEMDPYKNPFKVTDGECYYRWVRQVYPQWFRHFKEVKYSKEAILTKIKDTVFPKESSRRKIAKKLYRAIIKNN